MAQTLPSDLPGLELWLVGDSGITITNNLISQWNDLSGNDRHAISDFNSTRPSLLEGDLNGHDVVSFDGNVDFMYFDEITNLRTVFWVIRENPLAQAGYRRPLLGHPGGLYYTRSLEKDIWDANLTLPAVVNGTTRLNLQTIDGTNTTVPNEYSIISLVTSGNTPVSHITMEANAYGRTWYGEMAELIIFSEPLSSQQVLEVESYLAEKYGPTYTSLPDVNVTDNYCSTTLCAAEGFETYLWSTGSESSCIEVAQEGFYTLTLTDRFGRVIHDTIQVNFPADPPLSTYTICAGDSVLLEAPDQPFHHALDEVIVTGNIVIPTEGSYSYTLSDDSGCSQTYSFLVDIDSLSILLNLPDTFSICANNSIGFENDLNPSWQVWWNGEISGGQIIPSAPGYYFTQVMNENGCIFYDSTWVNIAGTAPEITIIYDTLCVGSTGVFEAQLLSDDVLTSWTWHYNNSTTTGPFLFINNLTSALSPITLETVSIEGCAAEVTITPNVYASPTLNILSSNGCANTPLTFVAEASSANGAIVTTTWYTGLESVISDTLHFTLTLPGSYFTNTIVVDEVGCVKGILTNYEIYSQPEIHFTTQNECLGQLTHFDLETPNLALGEVAYVNWDFGDNTSSSQQNPMHFYSNAGSYNVTVEVVTDYNCTNTFDSLIVIQSTPGLQFNTTELCQGDSFQLNLEQYTITSGEILDWHWEDENGNIYFDSLEVSTLIADTLQYVIQFAGIGGCESSLSHDIIVRPNPTAAFTYSPFIAEAPAQFEFTNLSEGASNYAWQIESIPIGFDFNFENTFLENGLYDVTLVVFNEWNCSSHYQQIIEIAPLILNMVMVDMNVEETPLGYQLLCRLMNSGNTPIENPTIRASKGSEWMVAEHIEGTIFPNEILDYNFQSLILSSGENGSILCCDAYTNQTNASEITLVDNSICESIEDTNVLLNPFPNPTSDELKIRFISKEMGAIELHVYNAMGQLVKSFESVSVQRGFNEWILETAELRSGCYTIEVKSPGFAARSSFLRL